MFRASEREDSKTHAPRDVDVAPRPLERRQLTLSRSELAELTGYRRAADQLRELHAQGFFRARVRGGAVILERAHYDAVCVGAKTASQPKVRLLVRHV